MDQLNELNLDAQFHYSLSLSKLNTCSQFAFWKTFCLSQSTRATTLREGFAAFPFFLSFFRSFFSFEDTLHQVDVFYLLSLWTKRSVLTLEIHTTPHHMTLAPEEGFQYDETWSA